MRDPRLVRAAGALVAIQIVHAAVPAKTTDEGYVGLVLGAIAIGTWSAFEAWRTTSVGVSDPVMAAR